MADSEATTRQQIRQFRLIVANVVGELRSNESRNSYAAVTLTELMDRHVQRLTATGPRPGRLHRLKAIYSEYKANIEAIKAIAPENFRTTDPDQDANTP